MYKAVLSLCQPARVCEALDFVFRVRRGSVEIWKAFVQLAFAFPLESEALAPILAEAEREMQRLRETY